MLIIFCQISLNFFDDNVINFFKILYDVIESILLDIDFNTIFANLAQRKEYCDKIFDDNDDENQTKSFARQRIV